MDGCPGSVRTCQDERNIGFIGGISYLHDNHLNWSRLSDLKGEKCFMLGDKIVDRASLSLVDAVSFVLFYFVFFSFLFFSFLFFSSPVLSFPFNIGDYEFCCVGRWGEVLFEPT